jgi:hypothetical protein
MSKIVQWKRGNTLVNSTYVGAQGEITVNTDNWELVVHDGVQPGGHPLGGNIGFGRLTISDQTISGTVVDDPIVLNPLGQYSAIQFNSNIFNLVGKDTDLVLTSSILGEYNPLGNVAQIIVQNSDITQPTALSLTANSQSLGLVINSDGYAGFNSFPGGYTFRVGGSISATEFYASADFPTGYQFTTPDGDTGLSHTYDTSQGNVSIVRIRHAGVEVAKFEDNLTTQITGNLVVTSGDAFGAFPTAFISMYANVDSYSQLVNQNINNGTDASSDFVATADNGNDSTYYIDLGIASSQHSDPAFFGDTTTVNDAYLYTVGYDQAGPSTGNVGNLIIGSTNGSIKLFVGNTAEANVVAKVTTDGIIPGANVTYSLGSQDYQWKDLWVSNNTIYIGGFPITVSADGVLSVNNSPVSTDRLSNGDALLSISSDGTLTLTHPSPYDLNTNLEIQKAPGNYHTISGAYGLSLQATPVPFGSGLNTNTNYVDIFHDGISINANANTWGFDTDGNLTIPTDKVIRYPSGTVYGGGGALNIEIDGGYPSSIFDGTSLVIDGGVV